MIFEDFLSYFEVQTRRDDSAQARCPCHNDKKASLSIKDCNGTILMYCHAGCENRDILEKIGLKFSDMYNATDNDTKWKSYVEDKKQKKIEAIYPYFMEDGSYCFTRLRLEGKDFTYGRLNNNKFIFGLNGLSRKKVCAYYGDIPKFNKAIADGETVYYVEGEKDVITMLTRGFPAVTVGASGDWSEIQAPLFKDANLVILADNDNAGMKLANNVKKDVEAIAKSVKIIVPMPDLEKGDISDYFLNHSEDDFLKMINTAADETLTVDTAVIAPEAIAPDLVLNKKGDAENTIQNCVEAISYDKGLYNKIRLNVIAHAPYVCGQLPWDDSTLLREWTNSDDANLMNYLETNYGLKTEKKIFTALTIVLSRNKYNPVVEMLEDVHRNHYDGNSGHIRELVTSYLGCEDTPYNEECLKLFMLGAISRAYYAGCKFDYCFTIYGEQGLGKSTFLRYLAMNNDWFNDNFRTIEGKEACENLRGMWIVEMAELLATKKTKHVEATKAFLTSTNDRFREPYTQRTESHPRVCVFSATVNNFAFLSDITGNRRWLIVSASKSGVKKSLFGKQEEVIKDFQNAWGEAMQIFVDADKHPPLVLSKESEAIAESHQLLHSEVDTKVGLVEQYLSDFKPNMKVCVKMVFDAISNSGMYHKTPDRFEALEISNILDYKIDNVRRYSGSKDGRYYFGVDYGKQQAWEIIDLNTKTEAPDSKILDKRNEAGDDGFTDSDINQLTIPFD